MLTGVLVSMPILPALAMTYAPISDGDLADRADVIALGTIGGTDARPGRDLWSTRYLLRIERTIKGSSDKSTVIAVPGGRDPATGTALRVPGAPQFTAGERVLLFLTRRRDGEFAISELALGAFHVRTARDGTQLALRELSQAHVVDGPGFRPEPASRNLLRFERWLLAYVAGTAAASTDYWTDLPVQPDLGKFATAGDPPVRWFDFDENRSVEFFAGAAGQQGVPGGGYVEFVEALAAWSTDPASSARYVLGGTRAADGGLSEPDGVNAILFNDPNNEIAGTYDCTRGGLLATTGTFLSGSAVFGGRNFARVVEANIVVRKGAGCFLSGTRNTNAAELFAHELGHSLGLGHPCGDAGVAQCVPGSPEDSAVMRPVMHADGRGSTLGNDDRQGLAYLYAWYPLSGPPSGSAPSGDATSDSSSGGGGGGGAVTLRTLVPLALILAFIPRKRRGLPAPRPEDDA